MAGTGLTERNPQGGGLGDLAALLGLFTGKEQTTQTKMSQSVMNQMLQSALEKNGGLAAVSSGQRGAGMYNSSTNQLMTNDLLSRLTGEIAQRGAPTTTTSPAAIDPMLGLGGLALLQAFSKRAKGAGDVAEAATGGGVGGAAAVTGGTSGGTGNFLTDTLSSISSSVSGGLDSIGNLFSFGGETAPAASGFQPTSINAINAGNVGNIDALMNAANFYGTDTLSQQTKQLIGQDFFGEGVGTDIGLGSIPWTAGLGNLAMGDLEGAIGSVGKSFVGSMFGNALTPVLGPLGPLLGGLLSGSSVICTELYRQGYIPKMVYDAEIRYATTNVSQYTYIGYRLWADWVVRKMRNSSKLTKLVSYIALPYIYHCASKVEPKVKGSVIGGVIGAMGVPICHLLGYIYTRQTFSLKDNSNG